MSNEELLPEMATQNNGPYQENILIDACGPILGPSEIARGLTILPQCPEQLCQTPTYIREHQLPSLWRLHIPTSTGIKIAQTIDILMRQGYVHRNPSSPLTWRRIYSRGAHQSDQSPAQLAAAVMGISGVGKTMAIERALHLKSQQVVIHEKFPNFVTPVHQLLWLKIDMPGSGRIADLVETLVRATDDVLGTRYAEEILGGKSRHGSTLAHEWLAKMACHFIGLIVIDEIQNLFKIETKKIRSVAAKNSRERPPLRIADDQALKFLLTLTNSSKIPLMVAGTPDGMQAFATRMSTAQRLVTGGYHHIQHATTPDDSYIRKIFLPKLMEYQWLPERLPLSDELRSLLHDLTGGVLRIYVALWIHAHKCAFDRGANCLDFSHFRHAAEHALAPLRPAVLALNSQDSRHLELYEDLIHSPNIGWA